MRVYTYKKICLFIAALACVFGLCFFAAANANGQAEPIAILQKSTELEEPLKIAKLYEQYIKGNEASENFQKALASAKKIEAQGTNEQIEQAAAELMRAVGEFHDYLFAPEKKKTKDADLIKALFIGGAKCAYDAPARTFYFTLGKEPNRLFEFDFYITSPFDLRSPDKKTAIFAELMDSGGEILPYGFVPEPNKKYALRAYSDTLTFDYSIVFTMLPIVQISDIGAIPDWYYEDCTISVTDPDFAFSPFDTSVLFYEDSAQIHIRGSSARGHPKKSYAIRFVDEYKNEKDASFFGIEKDSHWILDAMYNDMARMRNLVSTNLWLSFSCPPYYAQFAPKPVYNGIRGDFVELFVNDEYAGLYCLTTKINRNQLQLKRYDEENDIMHGISYKGKGWDAPLRFKDYFGYDNNSFWWASFQQKYPNPENGYSVDWAPLYELIRFVVDSDDETFKSQIGGMIDIDNYIDYTIFLCFSYAHDNTGKNQYWSVYDLQDPQLSKFFVTVWDLKSTWGRSWHPGPTSPNLEWMDSDPEHDTAIFRRLVLTNADGFADKLRERWNEVKLGAFSPEAVKAQFIQYFDLFLASGAFEREATKWTNLLNGHDSPKEALAAEREYILDWIDKRYTYIDDFFANKLGTVGDFAPRENNRRRR
ncbi:MAG: CotH kinase family protein [Oscillospiraceae bacterium]|nr:CotH kinase family protein [Oscillospiraceae bacterium]